MYNITLETFDLNSGKLLSGDIWRVNEYYQAIEKLNDNYFTQLDDVNFTRRGLSTYTNAKINFNNK